MRAVLLVGLAACSFSGTSSSVTGDGSARDAPVPQDATIDAFIPDAGPCQTLGASCANATTLRTCSATGVAPTDQACDWGCSTSGTAHCFVMQPSGGAVTSGDLGDPTGQLQDKTLIFGTTIDGDTGAISNLRGTGTGIQSGIDYEQRGSVAVFRFASLEIGGTITLVGSRPIALVSIAGMTLQGQLNAQGSCSGTTGGPGGGAGGAGQANGPGPGAGGGGHPNGGNNKASGGGGGGFGAAGGDSGQSTSNRGAAGATFGDATITALTGGGGGGGGANTIVASVPVTGGGGGGGGGGIQLVANRTIAFGLGGQIDASGCGGTGSLAAGGGGGGAGGAILIEAPAITVSGLDFYTLLAVNGGAGGGAGVLAGDGQDGQLSQARATGGGGFASGGAGGSTNNLAGATGSDGDLSGGGGGGVGWIRINTLAGTVDVTPANVSPTTTTMSQGVVSGQ